MASNGAASAAENDTSARLNAAGWRALEHLEAQIAMVDRRLKELPPGGFDEDLTRAGSGLARALQVCSGELRQLEKHDRRMTLTPEQRFSELLKYVRTLDARELGLLAGVLDTMKGSV